MKSRARRRRVRAMKNDYFGVGLNNIRYGWNFGAALRATECYGGSFVVYSGEKKRHNPKNMPTNVTRAENRLPLFFTKDIKSATLYNCVPVAVDMVSSAKTLFDYEHPERAFYIFGAENETLSDEILNACRDVICVPTEQCMNLGAAINVILYDRMLKQHKKENIND